MDVSLGFKIVQMIWFWSPEHVSYLQNVKLQVNYYNM